MAFQAGKDVDTIYRPWDSIPFGKRCPDGDVCF